MIKIFEDFKERIEDKEIKKLWDQHTGIKKKFFDFFYKELLQYKNPKILEFGVRHGVTTSMFLDICKQNEGELYSIDINDYSKKFSNSNWKFICAEDKDQKKIEKEIPNKFDIIFLDTIHKAEHVNEIFYMYYDKLKIGGLFIIDDTSWLPYTKRAKHDHFFKEINNRETFNRLLEIYNNNKAKLNISFNFCDTGTAKILKISDDQLNQPVKLNSREFSIKNLIRKLYIKLKK